MYSSLIERAVGLACTLRPLWRFSRSLTSSFFFIPSILVSLSFFIALGIVKKLSVLTAYSALLSSLSPPFDPSRSFSPCKSSLSSLISQGFRAFRGEIVSTTKGLKLRAESIGAARAKRQITINDEVASQPWPSRAINLRTVVCSMMLLFSYPPPFLSRFRLLFRACNETGRDGVGGSTEGLRNVFELCSESDRSDRIVEFVLSCLIIRVN